LIWVSYYISASAFITYYHIQVSRYLT